MKNLLKAAFAILFSLSIITFNSCCSTTMTDEEFMSISFDYGMKTMSDGMSVSMGKMTQEEFEKKTEPILKECCKKYGYSISDYKCKAKKLEKEQDKKINNALKN